MGDPTESSTEDYINSMRDIARSSSRDPNDSGSTSEDSEKKNKTKKAKKIVSKQVEISSDKEETGTITLLQSVQNSDEKQTRLILKSTKKSNYKKVLSVRDDNNNTLLHIAAKKSLLICQMLVECGCSINKRGAAGMLALHIAINYGKVPIVSYLLSVGAYVDVEDDKGQTPTDHLKKFRNNLPVYNTLFRDFKATGKKYYTGKRERGSTISEKSDEKKKDKKHKKSGLSASSASQSEKDEEVKRKNKIKKHTLKRNKKPPSTWDIEDVLEWLDEYVGFSEYIDNFDDAGINGGMLLSLTDEELENDLGITSKMHKRRLMMEIGNIEQLESEFNED